MKNLLSLLAMVALVAVLSGGCASHPALYLSPDRISYETLTGMMIINEIDGTCLVGVEDLDGRLRFLANVDEHTSILIKAWNQDVTAPLDKGDFIKWNRTIGVVGAAVDCSNPLPRATVIMFSPYPADSLAKLLDQRPSGHRIKT